MSPKALETAFEALKSGRLYCELACNLINEPPIQSVQPAERLSKRSYLNQAKVSAAE